MEKTTHIGFLLATLFLVHPAQAGGQLEEAMSANARASLQRAMADTPVTRTAFRDTADGTAWLKEMSRRLAKRMPDEAERLEFLTTLHWEASRAGVDPQLMLGLIQVESGFRNLRYGALIMRHYIDIERGDLYRALGRYNGRLGRPEYPTLVVGAWKRHWDYLPATKSADASAASRS